MVGSELLPTRQGDSRKVWRGYKQLIQYTLHIGDFPVSCQSRESNCINQESWALSTVCCLPKLTSVLLRRRFSISHLSLSSVLNRSLVQLPRSTVRQREGTREALCQAEHTFPNRINDGMQPSSWMTCWKIYSSKKCSTQGSFKHRRSSNDSPRTAHAQEVGRPTRSDLRAVCTPPAGQQRPSPYCCSSVGKCPVAVGCAFPGKRSPSVPPRRCPLG